MDEGDEGEYARRRGCAARGVRGAEGVWGGWCAGLRVCGADGLRRCGGIRSHLELNPIVTVC